MNADFHEASLHSNHSRSANMKRAKPSLTRDFRIFAFKRKRERAKEKKEKNKEKKFIVNSFLLT